MTGAATVAPMPADLDARMFKGSCPHGTWWLLAEVPDTPTPTGQCPNGCTVELTTMEPRTDP